MNDVANYDRDTDQQGQQDHGFEQKHGNLPCVLAVAGAGAVAVAVAGAGAVAVAVAVAVAGAGA